MSMNAKDRQALRTILFDLGQVPLTEHSEGVWLKVVVLGKEQDKQWRRMLRMVIAEGDE